ncbi:DEAD/DEAH box helicase [Mycobacterium sp. CVI_P3]|uniref:DEAD/DEAH box helicase n=1 Tax=Mycobacterium pinniadriaticum TaxID=2994102 RepID=A0ABT3SKA2_9MYCO|nr:DEAD/DEAH box helicase [Mycobacterium pinniadriaticum]MCX2933435.1 DEAD/DEAH box helicase [Mycobacterium pinniadriaticum]MCX2939926.1 DEAD/DEAH box helicase [Mycobacterium pinniadriaticum]
MHTITPEADNDRVVSEERKRPRFRTRSEPAVVVADPEALFGELPRTPAGVGALWSHQADQLRTYAADHVKSQDVALELPTGSGKTLVGLLIAEWRRRSMSQRVVYACPTKQLAQQVFDKATAQGVPVTMLHGSHRSWAAADVARYSMGAAVAISTYSTIFNLKPHLGDAQTLVFDDAHAAEGYVADAWALSVDRAEDAYHLLFDQFGDILEPAFVQRMVAPDSPTGDRGEVRLLPVTAVARKAVDLDRILSALTGDASYRFNMLRANLASCLIYVSRREFYIRPMIPPTFEHDAFVGAAQRLYLSATLGDAGELERAFGRTGIKRVKVPPAWDRAGSGRRFFVFPELAEPPRAEDTASIEGDSASSETAGGGQHDADSAEVDPSEEQTQDVVAERSTAFDVVEQLFDLADKRLVLTPDDAAAVRIADTLGIPAAERVAANNRDGLRPFLEAERATLLAPNRYDGMDLAAESCRMMLMAGLPQASHLQDRFLETRLGATEVLEERVRTRVLQGAGRCTRGPNDWAVVVVYGDEVLRFLSRAEVRTALPVELQAEIQFGLDQYGVAAEDLVLLAESALRQDDVWREDAEPELARMRRDSHRVRPANADALARSAEREVRAWAAAWRQDWETATRAAIDVLEHLTAEGLRPYRALWAYLGAAWSALAAAQDGDVVATERSSELLRRARRAATRTTWLTEIEPRLGEQVDADPVDEAAVEQIVGRLRGALASAAKYTRRSSEMLSQLSQTVATPYELGLSALGEFLGATESFKPKRQGRADAVWIFADLWITVEAKSAQLTDGALSMDYVRQTNTHLASEAGDRSADSAPPGSFSVIVSPRGVVEPDAVAIAEPFLHIVDLRLILDIAHDAVRAWNQLRGLAPGTAGEALHREAAQVLWEHRVLPTQLRERLSIQPIRRV